MAAERKPPRLKEVTSTEPSTCPKCGMRLVPSDSLPASALDQHEGHAHYQHDHGDDAHEHGDHGDGLEWEDLMPDINRKTDRSNMVWQLVDEEGGSANHEIFCCWISTTPVVLLKTASVPMRMKRAEVGIEPL